MPAADQFREWGWTTLDGLVKEKEVGSKSAVIAAVRMNGGALPPHCPASPPARCEMQKGAERVPERAGTEPGNVSKDQLQRASRAGEDTLFLDRESVLPPHCITKSGCFLWSVTVA